MKEEVERLKEEMEGRDECEVKVQEYVQTLIANNQDLQRRFKSTK